MAKTVQLKSGTFTLPAGLKARSVVLTVTAAADDTSVTITDPNGAVWWAATLNDGGSATHSGINLAELPAGIWAVTITGAATGTFTAS